MQFKLKNFELKKQKRLSEINIGQTVEITSIENDDIFLKLMEMGCVPGEKITVEYFAEGTEVAVKVNKNNEGEHKLNAKGVTEGGNPLFSDGEVVWEMNSDGTSGTLTEKGGKVTVFK